MILRIVWWALAGTGTTIDALRECLRGESVDAFGAAEGLRLKLWIADAQRDRWGAVYLWDSAQAAAQRLPSRVREIIGNGPDFEEYFELEASVEGAFA